MPRWEVFKGLASTKSTGPGPDPRPDCSAFGKIHILYWQGEGVVAQIEALGESELTEYGGLDIPR
jgi:hypothetical protein